MTSRQSTSSLQSREILLLEDNSGASERRHQVGVSRQIVHSTITIRVHRISGTSSQLAASRTYKVGTLSGERNGRIQLAMRLLDRAKPKKGCVVAAGTSYGSAATFLRALSNIGLSFVVQVRPSTLLDVLGTKAKLSTAGELLAGGQWEAVTLPLLDGTKVDYVAAKLADVDLTIGPAKLFAARVGGVEGAQRSTIIGLSSFDASISELVQIIGYTRWIRPISRRQDRAARGVAGRAEPEGNAATLRARANITSARQQDDRAREGNMYVLGYSPRGVLQSCGSTLNVAELFAGAGGMGLGFLLATGGEGRYRLVYSGEVNPIYVQTLRTNHEALPGVVGGAGEALIPEYTEAADLRREETLASVKEVGCQKGGIHVLIGGPPCQGFSMANRNSWHGRNPHNRLVDVFFKYVEELRPKVFLMENVQGILWTPKGGRPVSVVDVIERRMRAAGYIVFPKLLDAVWYGVPQHRTRFFLMGLHRDLGYRSDSFGEWGPFPVPTHGGESSPWVTTREALADLPRIGNGASVEDLAYIDPSPAALKQNPFLNYIRDGAERGLVFDHVTSRHAEYVIDRYRKIPPGGNWESIREELSNYADVSRTHSNIYRRLRWDEPSITIGHYRKSMLVHPSQHRGLSLREAARLQSFPDWFHFAGTVSGRDGGIVHKQQQLANAVCPLVTKAVAEFILHL